MTRPPRLNSTSAGYMWASRVTTLAMEFALPALAGAGLDRFWRFQPLGVIVGAGLGFFAGMVHLLALAKKTSSPPDDGRPNRDD